MSLLLKFGVLFMRTVAKPVSNMVKAQIKEHQVFRKLAVGGARLHSRTNARWDRIVRRRPVLDKKGNPITRRELTETEAIDLAADIIGEVFLLSGPPGTPRVLGSVLWVVLIGRAVATAGLWFQQTRSNKAEKEEKQALLQKLKDLQLQLEIAGRALVQSDRQHAETRKDLESAINDLKLEIRHIHGDWSDFQPDDMISKEEVWEVIAADDAKRGGRREMPKLKGEWQEILDRLRDGESGERERRYLPVEFV